jgi:hypothetical protein
MNRKSLLNLNFYAKTSIERALSKDSSFFLRTQSKETKNQKKGPPAKPAKNEEKASSGCTHHFGYLASHPKSTPIPQECLFCPKLLECTLKMNDSY